jgi:uncharacterized caspase-like protein
MPAGLLKLVLAGALLAFSYLAAEAEDRLALVIGNSKYQFTSPLANPGADAGLIARTLEASGFEVMLRNDLSQDDFSNAILEFASKAENLEEGDDGETIALVFYAGHGIQSQGENYLIPVDAQVSGGRDLRRRGISVNSIVEDLAESNAKLKILILDACRNNPFPAADRSGARGLAPIKPIDDFIIAFSTDPGNTAKDGDGTNSPYSEALATFMQKPELTVYEVFGSTYAFVKNMTNGQQKPSATYQIDGRRLHFTPSRSVAVASPQANTLIGAEPAQQSAAVLWEKAKERNTVEAYDAVISRFPDSEEAKRAVMMIGLLGDEKAWQEAKGRNSEGGFKIYLQLYPNGIYAAEAQRQIDRLGEVQTAMATDPEAPAKPAAPSSGMRVFFGADADGFDYRSFKSGDFEACKTACEGDAECKAVTYNRAKSICMLKSGADLVIGNATADAAVVDALADQVRRTSIEVMLRTDISGSDYRDQQGISFIECLLACEGDQVCRSFSYIRAKKWCWMKSDAGQIAAKKGVDSGVKR